MVVNLGLLKQKCSILLGRNYPTVCHLKQSELNSSGLDEGFNYVFTSSHSQPTEVLKPGAVF